MIKVITGIRRCGKSVILRQIINEIIESGVKDENKEYYQVCYYLSDDKIISREFDVYDNIRDNYPKYVISMDKFDLSQNGIIHKNIIDWLLDK